MKDALGRPQSALVLGAGSDIAAAILRRLAEGPLRSAVLAARDTGKLDPLVDELRGAGVSSVATVDFDAADSGAHGTLVDEVFERHGDIDLAVLAFGLLGDQEACEKDPAQAVEVGTVNYLGVVSTGLHLARRMREQGHGVIVVLSSVAAERARRANFVYGSSKAGADAFSQGLADSLVGTGVRVVVVRPGFVHTKMTAGRDAAPFSTTADAVAEACVKALSSKAETVWVPGLLRYVMAVMRHLPRPVFRKLKA